MVMLLSLKFGASDWGDGIYLLTASRV